MKILVLSDSHSALSFMRRCIEAVKPDAVVHLGDHYDDGCAMAEEFPKIRFYQVPGNCDRYRGGFMAAETLVDWVCGVKLFMTHGHIHRVKMGFYSLVRDAEAAEVQAVLFGHTHEAYCQQTEKGMWVVNPGSCGYYGGTAALIQVADKKISDCRIIGQSDLEALTVGTETQVR
jgi:putative phosphoesterase